MCAMETNVELSTLVTLGHLVKLRGEICQTKCEIFIYADDTIRPNIIRVLIRSGWRIIHISVLCYPLCTIKLVINCIGRV